MKASRRQVVAGGGLTMVALGMGITPYMAGAATYEAAPALLLLDRALGARADAGWADLRSADIEIVSYTRDCGEVLSDRLTELWGRGLLPVAGLTTGGALFCVEHQAARFGLVCSYREGLVPGEALQPNLPVAWLMRPRSSTPRDGSRA